MGRLDEVQTLSTHKGRVWNVCWHPKGATFASCGEDKTIRLWGKDNSNKWVQKVVLTEGHQRTIREVSWSPCGSYLASASFDATTAIWDNKIGEFECNATLEGHENEVKSVAWSQSGQHLATCSRDKSVWVWEVAGDDEYVCAAVLNAHTQDVKKVIWHPNSDVLASCSYDNTIKIFKEDPSDNDWFCSATLESHASTVWGIAFDASGDRIVSGSDDRTLKIWKEYKPGNAEGIVTPENDTVWKCVCTLSGYHSRTVYDVAWSHLNGVIATASGDDIIRLFKEADGSNENEPTFEMILSVKSAHSQDVNAVKWHPTDPNLLLSCSDDGSIKVWKLEM